MIACFGLGLAMFPGLLFFFLTGLPGSFLIRCWLRGEVRLGHRFALRSASAKLLCAA
jgi:hypothetical protein